MSYILILQYNDEKSIQDIYIYVHTYIYVYCDINNRCAKEISHIYKYYKPYLYTVLFLSSNSCLTYAFNAHAATPIATAQAAYCCVNHEPPDISAALL